MRPHFVVLGVPVRISPFVAFLALFFLQGDPFIGILAILTLLGSVLVHELGHAMMFRRYGLASYIELHAFGGFTMPLGGGLDDKQQIKVSLAGPLTQLITLGIPSLAALWFLDPGGVVGTVLVYSVFFNIGWALINLIPLYPLDGGHVLYHSMRLFRPASAWQVTRVATVAVGIPLAFLAWRAGFVFAVIFVGLFIYRALTGDEPGRSGGRIGEAAERARANTRVETKGEAGDRSVAEAYQLLAEANWNRFEFLVAGLSNDQQRQFEVAKLLAWRNLIEHDAPASPHAPGLLGAVSGGPGSASAQEFAALLSASLADHDVLPAVVVLRRRGQLGEVLMALDVDDLERLEDRLVAGGLSEEQRIVAGAISVRETHS